MRIGLTIVGRDYYGIFPLKGKPLNVRDAKPSKVAKNTEIAALKKIIGLEVGKKYDTEESRKRLRYGKGVFYVQ